MLNAKDGCLPLSTVRGRYYQIQARVYRHQNTAICTVKKRQKENNRIGNVRIQMDDWSEAHHQSPSEEQPVHWLGALRNLIETWLEMRLLEWLEAWLIANVTGFGIGTDGPEGWDGGDETLTWIKSCCQSFYQSHLESGFRSLMLPIVLLAVLLAVFLTMSPTRDEYIAVYAQMMSNRISE